MGRFTFESWIVLFHMLLEKQKSGHDYVKMIRNFYFIFKNVSVFLHFKYGLN